MNKSILFGAIFALVILSAGFGSAYWYDDYKTEHYVKETYGVDGYKYVEKNVEKDPWGEVTTYKKVNDYGWGYPSRSYNIVRSNPVVNYWNYGKTGYSSTWKSYDVRYADAYNPTYYDYYYKPVNLKGYYDHSYSAYNCGQRCYGGRCC